ncbi:hypothetical protein X831_gp174 [Pseudomonas phage PAK_P2]|uniref:Uncharacterized protein n=1 Tax=Pseudomonas phage PAK_P2 TaxID=1348912 RepID=V5JWY7_9CAUD|nr:hypothetical protein X831_gp174 [Pseudomonas phage PAK_P2]AGR89294.1 hypothetical protein PAK_P200173 [Pseudomonas phage PAK_P2]
MSVTGNLLDSKSSYSLFESESARQTLEIESFWDQSRSRRARLCC